MGQDESGAREGHQSPEFDRKRPYNSLPLLPPSAAVESVSGLKLSARAQVALAELREAADRLPNQSIMVRALQVQEAKQSSEIENIVTTNDALYAGLDPATDLSDPAAREVFRHSDAIWLGYEQISGGRLISPSLIQAVAEVIKFEGIAVRRLPGTAIVNSATREAAYTPPEGEELIRSLLWNLCEYLATSDGTDPLIKMAVAHYQFEAIHPFPDGNGRTGRVLNMLYLLQSGLLRLPIIYLSRPILARRLEYYRGLLGVTERDDWETWVTFMLEVTLEAAQDALKRIRSIEALMAEVEGLARAEMRRGFSRELIELIFRLPYTRIQNLETAGIAKRDAASEYLRELERLGIVRRQKVGREALFVNERFLAALID